MVVGERGLEPPQVLPYMALNHARLPIPPPALLIVNYVKAIILICLYPFLSHLQQFLLHLPLLLAD